MNLLEYKNRLRSVSESLRTGEISAVTAAGLLEVFADTEVEGYPDPLPSRQNVGPTPPLCSRCRNSVPARDFSKLICGKEHDECFSMDEDIGPICPDFVSRYIEYPIVVNSISVGSTAGLHPTDAGHMQFVRVRPCGEEYGGRTYLGIFLGDMVDFANVYRRGETKVLEVLQCTNPAMYVPELGKIIWGRESFWSRIASEADFKDITDEEQQNVFYMRWLRELAAGEKPAASEEGEL